MNLVSGAEGEQFPVGTVINITLLQGYEVKLSEVAIIDSLSNIEKISVEYKDYIGNKILDSKNNFISVNPEGSPPTLNSTILPRIPVSQIRITILELKNNSMNTSVTISVKGYFGNVESK